MATMKDIYTAHHGDEMGPDALNGLAKLLDEDRTGELDEDEVAALTSSPAMRDWIRSSAASFGMHAARRWAEGKSSSIDVWFAELRPVIRAQLRGVAR